MIKLSIRNRIFNTMRQYLLIFLLLIIPEMSLANEKHCSRLLEEHAKAKAQEQKQEPKPRLDGDTFVLIYQSLKGLEHIEIHYGYFLKKHDYKFDAVKDGIMAFIKNNDITFDNWEQKLKKSDLDVHDKKIYERLIFPTIFKK